MNRLVRVLAGILALALAWTVILILTGGFRVEFGGLRLSSRDPSKVVTLALLAGAALLGLRLWTEWRRPSAARPPDRAESPTRLPRRGWVGRGLRALIVLALIGGYCAWVFHLSNGFFLASGLGDWLDPYFINYLPEHWLQSLWHVRDPFSPPMYFPARGTLGYSHGLVLYVPFYALVRPWLDPFPAYTLALFLVMLLGSVSLYVWMRKVAALGLVEALLLTAFFATSANVINSGTNAWTQRLSVFLIPMLALLTMHSVGLTGGFSRALAASAAGFVSALLLIQDTYTAQFALLMGGLLGAPFLASASVRGTIAAFLRTPHGQACGLGALLGLLLFLTAYLPVFLERGGFPAEQLNNTLAARDSSVWQSPIDLLRGLKPYDSARTFVLAIALVFIALAPGSRLDTRSRLYAAWFLGVSAIVLLVAVRFGEFSLWRALFAPLPGFSAIRDPKRIIYLYELAAVVVIAGLLARVPAWSRSRLLIVGLVGVLLASDWNTGSFRYRRSVATFNGWVRAPLVVDPSCASFFIKGASADYMARGDNMWGLYNIDAMFVALQVSRPTLNGYSAWAPDGWALAHPEEAAYLENVDRWIEQHELRHVCALDIDARTITPYVPVPRAKEPSAASREP